MRKNAYARSLAAVKEKGGIAAKGRAFEGQRLKTKERGNFGG